MIKMKMRTSLRGQKPLLVMNYLTNYQIKIPSSSRELGSKYFVLLVLLLCCFRLARLRRIVNDKILKQSLTKSTVTLCLSYFFDLSCPALIWLMTILPVQPPACDPAWIPPVIAPYLVRCTQSTSILFWSISVQPSWRSGENLKRVGTGKRIQEITKRMTIKEE